MLIPNRFQPSFVLFPLANARTAYQPVWLPTVLCVPWKRDADGVPLIDSDVSNLVFRIENAPSIAPVAGHQYRGLYVPNTDVYVRPVDLSELVGLKIDVSVLQFYDRDTGAAKSFSSAIDGDYFDYVTAMGELEGQIVYYADADYYDLSTISIETADLKPLGKYVVSWNCNYNRRISSPNSELFCIDTMVSLARLAILFDHPGDIHQAMINWTPKLYFDDVSPDKDTTIKFYRPFADALQDVFDESTLLEGINWIDKIPAQYLPYLAYLLGWDLPAFPDATDEMKRRVLANARRLQELKGSKQCLQDLFEIFGYAITLTNLWYAIDGTKFIAPNETDFITKTETCKSEALLADYHTDGFGELTIPLLNRPNGLITIEAWYVDTSSSVYSDLQDALNTLNIEGTPITGTDGSIVNSGLHDFLSAGPVNGYSRIVVDQVLGTIVQSSSVGVTPLGPQSAIYDKSQNIINLTFGRNMEFDTNERLIVYATYKYDKLTIDSEYADLQSNRFDIEILEKASGQSVDMLTLEFLLDYVFKLKAFHSLLRKIKFNYTTTDVYNVTDFCCLPNTKITMEDMSVVNIENVNIGDSVLTIDGTTNKVLKTMSRLVNEDIIVLSCYGTGRPLKVTGNHPIYVCKFNKVGKRGGYKRHKNQISYIRWPQKDEFEWLRADQISENDLVMVPIPKSSEVVYERILEAEFVGYYAAEGDCRDNCVRFSLGGHEMDLALRIKYLAESLGGKCTISASPLRKSNIFVYTYGKSLVTIAKQAGNGAHFKRIPEWIMNSTIDIASTFIMALIEGDGSFTGGTASRVTLTSTSITLCEQLYWLLAKHDIESTKWFGTSPGGPSNRSKLSYRGMVTINKRAASKLWKHISPPSFNNAVYHRIADNIICIRVKKIHKESYNGVVYNLEIDNNHTYVANNILVHNCAGGDITQKPGTSAGDLQIPPPYVPASQTTDGNCVEPSIPENLALLRAQILNGLEEEFLAWKALDDTHQITDRSTVDSLTSVELPADPTRTECQFTDRGQDKKIAAEIDLDQNVDNRETACEKPRKDYCYVGRVNGEIFISTSAKLEEIASCKICTINYGKGFYYLENYHGPWCSSTTCRHLDDKTNVDKSLLENATVRMLGFDQAKLKYVDKPYFSIDLLDDRSYWAIMRPSLQIDKHNYGIPGHRFPTYGIENTFVSSDWVFKPWDDIFHKCPENAIGITIPNLNTQIGIDTNGDEVLSFDSYQLTYYGTGIPADIPDYNDHASSTAFVTHKIITTAPRGHEAITLDGVVYADELSASEVPDTICIPSEIGKIFDSANDVL